MTRRHELVTKFLNTFERIAPLKLADSSWDNVGLLYEALYATNIQLPFRILVTNDLSHSVFDEAREKKTNLILTYHPVWFKPEKKLNYENTTMTRLVILCASSNISIFSPHTALDSVEGGMNDYIMSIIGLDSSSSSSSLRPIKPIEGSTTCGLGRIATIMTHDNTTRTSLPTIKRIMEMLKETLNLPYIRYALPHKLTLESTIESVAVCVGAGASILLGCDAQLLITGEMTHHDILRATEMDESAVILTEHSRCERPFLQNILCQRLSSELEQEANGCFLVEMSTSDADPTNLFIQ